VCMYGVGVYVCEGGERCMFGGRMCVYCVHECMRGVWGGMCMYGGGKRYVHVCMRGGMCVYCVYECMKGGGGMSVYACMYVCIYVCMYACMGGVFVCMCGRSI
jgi:hypothetical protein